MRILVVVLIATACNTSSVEPPRSPEISDWAAAASYKLDGPRDCPGIETKYFGAKRAVCWSAKSTIEQHPGSRLFPRFQITLADHGSETRAKLRITKFHDVPKEIAGPIEKTYSLRAGFRVGSRVVIVTTDALTFRGDVTRAAAELAKVMHGSELTCWQQC